jgi:hypothetical protein
MNAILGGKLPMERLRAQMLDGDRGLLDEIEESITIPEWPGVPEWRGRFWLPDSAQVQPAGKNRLIPDDEGAILLFAESFAPRDVGPDVAVSKDRTRFE